MGGWGGGQGCQALSQSPVPLTDHCPATMFILPWLLCVQMVDPLIVLYQENCKKHAVYVSNEISERLQVRCLYRFELR